MQVRVNLVPESARHLQMTRTRQMRVICVRVRVIYLRPTRGPRGPLQWNALLIQHYFSPF